TSVIGDHVDNCSPTGVAWDDNIFFGGDAAIPGSGDCTTGLINSDPDIATVSGWRNVTAGTINASDFALLEGSPAIDAGTDLTSYDDIIASADYTASPPTVTTGDQNDYGVPKYPTLTDEVDGAEVNEELNLTHVAPVAGSQSHDIGAILASNTHSQTTWQMINEADGDDDSDCSDEVADGSFAAPEWDDNVSSADTAWTPSSMEYSTIYCWRAATGNVAGLGAFSAVDQFATLSLVGAGQHDGHTSGSASADLEDIDAAWTIDALIGCTVTNVTNSETCEIADNDADTVICDLSGAETWDIADEYSIDDCPTPAPTTSQITVGSAGTGTATVGSAGTGYIRVHP
ncbi:unnamed protein product, partial [marine sediment metagenome]